jgi:hypothetical protein
MGVSVFLKGNRWVKKRIESGYNLIESIVNAVKSKDNRDNR